MLNAQSYTETFEMKYGEGDILGRVRPSTLLRCVEHVALKHASILGITRAFNESHNMVFLVAKQAIAFYRMPRADETLTFTTQPEQSKRITFRRVTLITDAQGQEVACVDSQWVLMDLVTRRLLRRSPVAFDANWAQELPQHVPFQISRATQCQPCGNVTACYAQCDSNGHLNNANYLDVVFDALPIEAIKNGQINRIAINYHRELVLGDCMQLQVGQTEQGFYVTGHKDGLVTFEAFCKITE